MKLLILALGITANASASILIKIALIPPRKVPSLDDPLGSLTNWPFWLGLVLYGVAFLFYTAALMRLPLNIAHPILTTGTIAVVTLYSLCFLNEPFYWTTLTGIILVALGVTFLTIRIS